MKPPIAAHHSRHRVGVLLVNLGTPDAPEAPAIRRYLREFLSDRRVVEIPRLPWWLILNLFILPFRPRKLVHAYGSIWTAQGSPLLAVGRKQAAALQASLGQEVIVELAMRYGQPSIQNGMERLRQQGIDKLLVLPLYPQYSATTTATVMDAVFDVLKQQRWLPELRTVNSYHDVPAYIDALAASVRQHWDEHGRGDHLLLSFHSIPLRCLELGDPYYCHCQKTGRLLAAALELNDGDWSLSFQSRVGNAQWLTPYTDETVVELARKGVAQLDVICPGFAADCLETLEEVALRYGDDFRQAGGQALRYIPALNAEPAHIAALSTLVRRHSNDWAQTPSPDEAPTIRDERASVLAPSLNPR